MYIFSLKNNEKMDTHVFTTALRKRAYHPNMPVLSFLALRSMLCIPRGRDFAGYVVVIPVPFHLCVNHGRR